MSRSHGYLFRFHGTLQLLMRVQRLELLVWNSMRREFKPIIRVWCMVSIILMHCPVRRRGTRHHSKGRGGLRVPWQRRTSVSVRRIGGPMLTSLGTIMLAKMIGIPLLKRLRQNWTRRMATLAFNRFLREACRCQLLKLLHSQTMGELSRSRSRATRKKGLRKFSNSRCNAGHRVT